MEAERVPLTDQVSFRVTAAEAEEFARLRLLHDRTYSDMARRVWSAGLRAMAGKPADGAAEVERLLRVYHREPMSQDCRDGDHFGECFGCRCICHGRPS